MTAETLTVSKMRRGFEGAMNAYGDFAKDDKEAQKKRREAKDTAAFFAAEKEIEVLQDVIKYHADRRARVTDTDMAAQKEIYSLQKRKQEIMEGLKADIASLDGAPAPEQKESLNKNVRLIVERDGQLFWDAKDGTSLPVTIGEIVTDGEWGTEYAADAATVSRVTRKRMLVEQAKRQIHDLLDEQIFAEELASGRVHGMLKDAYAALRERRESGSLPHGVIAEKMTAQLVRKKILDDDAQYRYEGGDVFQDVVRKIDFVIRRADYGRGVKVEDADLGSKAVQLTVNRDAQALSRKRAQIDETRRRLQDDDRIDDIALVQLDQRLIADAFRAWEKAGRPPGGPDKLLPPQVRERMFEELVAGM